MGLQRLFRLVLFLSSFGLLLNIFQTLNTIRPSRYIFCDFGNGKQRILRSEVPLFVITPTYKRMTQLPDMIRLGQTLKVNY